jgi:predicted dienelactone hydrolase
MKQTTTLALITALVIVSSSAATRAADAELYKVKPGTHEVQVHRELLLHDDARDFDLPLRVTFPKTEGKYPLIVYSHGLFGSKDAYDPIVKHWVSHGYVVVQATHGDSLQRLRNQPRGRRGNPFNHWRTRPEDVKLILDSLDTIEEKVTGLKGRIDRDKIGMGGHSFGAHTSMLIGGATYAAFNAGRRLDLADDRPGAILLISPQGTGGMLDKRSWEKFTRPTLIITGTNDTTRQGDKYTKRLDPFRYCPPGDKYLLFIEGAYHGFGGISGAPAYPSRGPDNETHINYVRSASTALWDAHLKDDEAARAFLDSDTVNRATDDKAKMFVKQKEGDAPKLPGDE